MGQIEFVADEEGDCAMHCHKRNHSMNAMGHDVPTMIGFYHRGIIEKILKLVSDYMVKGERGMVDLTEMTMPLSENTLPMTTGDRPCGSVEMGELFSMLKVRADLAPDDTVTQVGINIQRAIKLMNTMVSYQSCPNNLLQATRSWLRSRSWRQLIFKLSSQSVTRVNSKIKIMSV